MNNFEVLKKEILNELQEKLNLSLENYNLNVDLYQEDKTPNIELFKGRGATNSSEYYISSGENLEYINLNSKIIVLFKGEIISNINIKFSRFNKCVFKNIVFNNCDISDTFFSGCIFDNVTFDNCRFINSDSGFVVFQEECEFLGSTFKNCNLEKCIFISSKLNDSRLMLTDLKNSIMSEVNIRNLHIADCDMRGYKVINSDIHSLSFEDEYLTKLNEDSFFDEIKFGRKNTENMKSILKIYKDISTKFEANRLPNKSGEYYYLYKKLENKTLSGLDRIKSYIYWMLCGYGEKPTYALITSIEIVLLFTILYMFTGLSIGMDVIDYDFNIISNLPIDGLVLDFLKSLYFSVVTFTTVGYGDITPIGLSVFLSGIEMFLGVTMVGIWTATLARKITR